VSLDEKPIIFKPTRAPINQGVALTAVAQAMYSSTLWPTLEFALSEAQQGRGVELLIMYDNYYQRGSDGTYGNELEAFNAIMCLDDPGPKSVEGVDKYYDDFMKVAPRLGSSFATGYVCTFWPTETDARVKITGQGAGPIVVIGTTGDAATPLQSSRNMAKALEDGRLIVVNDNRHTGYGSNQCVVDAANKYLITTTVTWSEKDC
jgi:pimeloyl-ACP methyl ester carboxylesterase